MQRTEVRSTPSNLHEIPQWMSVHAVNTSCCWALVTPTLTLCRMWGMNPIPDTDLTCISNYTAATYSGFLPAVLAGQKSPEEMEIDLVKLCSSVGARLITNEVVGLDHDRNEVLFADRPAVPFDVLSIGIGSVPYVGAVSVAGDSLIKIKPMQTFLDRLTNAVEQAGSEVLRLVVVGGGVAGVEVTFCLPEFLCARGCDSPQLSVITASDEILPEVVTRTREKVLGEFASSRRRNHDGSADCPREST